MICMKKKLIKIVIFSVTFLIVVVLIPVLIDQLVFGNSIPSNLANGEWASFLGSYIGGLCTLIALIATMCYYRKSDEKKEKAEVQPFLHIVVSNESRSLSSGFLLPGKTEKNIDELQQVNITIKNIGNGFANTLVIHTGQNFGGLEFRRVIGVNESTFTFFMVDTEMLENGLQFAVQFVDSMRNEYIQQYDLKRKGSKFWIDCGYPVFIEKRK